MGGPFNESLMIDLNHVTIVIKLLLNVCFCSPISLIELTNIVGLMMRLKLDLL